MSASAPDGSDPGQILDGKSGRPTREEMVAELILLVRATVRELGEPRAIGSLKKFCGRYRGRGRLPWPFGQELVQLEMQDEVDARLFAAPPGAVEALERPESALLDCEDDVALVLPISICGGG